MRDAEIIADLIISRFINNGGAQGARNYFGYKDTTTTGVKVSRQGGGECRVSRQNIIAAVNAVRAEPEMYDAGPGRLRPYIARRILSPLWAMLHLVSLEEIKA